MWKSFCYYQIYPFRFSQQECQLILDLNYRKSPEIHSVMSNRDCNLVWVSRSESTEWIFERLGSVVAEYNREYGFDLSPEMSALQLTRYSSGQYYDWHMDLGAS